MAVIADTLAYEADTYALSGIPVFPLKPGTKTPITEHGFKDATTDREQVRRWWTQHPDANIGSPIPAGYVVFDVDDPEKIDGLDDDVTALARTGGKHEGYHVWYRLPDGVKLKASQKLPGIDVLSEGHYVVLPPSRVESEYTWIAPQVLGSNYRYVQPLPDHLLNILSQDRSILPVRESDPNFWVALAIDKVRNGATRNDTGLWLACQLRDTCQMSEDDAAGPMGHYQETVDALGDHPYTAQEALKTIRSAYSQEAREQAHAQTDEGLIKISAGLDDFSSLHFPCLVLSSLDLSSMRVHFMGLCESADLTEVENMGDKRCQPGSPKYIRRQAQYPVIEAVWSVLAPGDKLPRNIMNTWLAAHMELEPGTECIQVVDCLLTTYENYLNHGRRDIEGRLKPLRNPRAYYTNAIMHQLDPDYGYKRAELKERVKAAKAKEQEPVEALVRVWEE